jgi:hypothetical protein
LRYSCVLSCVLFLVLLILQTSVLAIVRSSWWWTQRNALTSQLTRLLGIRQLTRASIRSTASPLTVRWRGMLRRRGDMERHAKAKVSWETVQATTSRVGSFGAYVCVHCMGSCQRRLRTGPHVTHLQRQHHACTHSVLHTCPATLARRTSVYRDVWVGACAHGRRKMSRRHGGCR